MAPPKESRTFIIDAPNMKGTDIEAWQRTIKSEFADMGIDCPIKADGIYGVGTRSFSASLCEAMGMLSKEVMKDGVTPELRIRVRNSLLTKEEEVRFHARVAYRRKLRERYASAQLPAVHRPVAKIVEDSWGFHPGVHDGLDVITLPDPVIFAMVKCRIFDVRSEGWWGLGAPSNPALKAKGDGIIQMEILETVGPFKRGHHIGYGHSEKAVVKEGQIVNAGDPVGHAGFANAWHIHMMYNDGSTTRGKGNLDPKPLVDYAVEHG